MEPRRFKGKGAPLKTGDSTETDSWRWHPAPAVQALGRPGSRLRVARGVFAIPSPETTGGCFFDRLARARAGIIVMVLSLIHI